MDWLTAIVYGGFETFGPKGNPNSTASTVTFVHEDVPTGWAFSTNIKTGWFDYD